jgi:fructose-bisphosphate aldolase class 1
MTYSYGRALQQSALKFWSKDIKILRVLKKYLIIELKCVHLQLKENGQRT